MSHRRERTEKNCLNCNTEVAGRFCQSCGQENVEPRETAWHLIEHFFSDITHFDGKFFQSVWLLFSRPGFLSKQYSLGRRAAYLNPIRMYVFTSALFFLIFFATFNARKMTGGLDKIATTIQDSVQVAVSKDKTHFDIMEDSTDADSNQSLVILDSAETNFFERIKTVAQYDSAQLTLAPGERDGWLKRLIISRSLKVNNKYARDRKELIS